tara:strand:- start:7745 stop:8347 length:603 start_codon:yes stop_codon:yes gene_type:complete
MAKRSNKRERLIDAAIQLFYQQGFHQTTIADIAKLSDVPLGNVYYYFKTKDEICDAVIKARFSEVKELINELNSLSSGFERIQGLINFYLSKAEQVSHYGNIFSSLVQELSKHESPLANDAKSILTAIVEWLDVQFADYLGTDNKELTYDSAMQLFANIQGMQILTLAFQDPKITEKQASLLTKWLKSLKITADIQHAAA